MKKTLLGGAAALALALALPLAACGPSSSTAAGTDTAGGGDGGVTRDQCLIGSWQVDLDDLAQQMSTIAGSINAGANPLTGATTSTGGSIGVTFGDSMVVDYNADITLTVTGTLPITDKITYSGTATSTDWHTDNGSIEGTGTSTFSIGTTMTMAGQVVPVATSVGGGVDLSAGTLTYTCSGNSATLTSGTSGGAVGDVTVTWKLIRA